MLRAICTAPSAEAAGVAVDAPQIPRSLAPQDPQIPRSPDPQIPRSLYVLVIAASTPRSYAIDSIMPGSGSSSWISYSRPTWP